MQDVLKQKKLTEKEKKNVYLAMACECMKSIHDTVPGPEHSKKKRMLADLSSRLIKSIGPRLSRVSHGNMEIFISTIKAGRLVMSEIIKDGNQPEHVILNLARYCCEQLPMRDSNQRKLTKLFELWDDASENSDPDSGERLFARIDKEMQKLVSQKTGILL